MRVHEVLGEEDVDVCVAVEILGEDAERRGDLSVEWEGFEGEVDVAVF